MEVRVRVKKVRMKEVRVGGVRVRMKEVGAKEADLACNNSPSPYFLDQHNLEHSRNYLVESILDLLSSLNRRRSRPRTLEVLYHYC